MNPIQYTSIDFDSVLTDLNSDKDLADKPMWFKKAIAGLVDVGTMLIEARANNAYLRTAYTRKAVADLLQLINYFLSPNSTSSGLVRFDASRSISYPQNFSTSDLVAMTQGSLSQTSLRFEAIAAVNTWSPSSETFSANATTDLCTVALLYYTGDIVRLTTTGTLPAGLSLATDYYAIYVSATTIRLATSRQNAKLGTYIDITDTGTGVHTIKRYEVITTCYQQTSLLQFIPIGTANSSDDWQTFKCPDANVVLSTLQVQLNSIAWTRVDTLIDSGPTDKHFRAYYDTSNFLIIQFGNGTYGARPGNFDVNVFYAFGGGTISNISNQFQINTYAGGSANIQGAENVTTMTGGADPESIDNAKVLGPLLLAAQNRFVTTNDGFALAVKYSGVGFVGIIPNFYGALTCKVMVVPSGGGNPSGTLKTNLSAYLESLTTLNSVFVGCVDPTYNVIAPNVSAKILPGYTWGSVSLFITLALRLFFTEAGYEVSTLYTTGSISGVLDFINTKWGTSFTLSDAPNIVPLVTNLPYRTFGETIQESVFSAYISRVLGLSYFTYSSPTFPYVNAVDAITQAGSITLAQL